MAPSFLGKLVLGKIYFGSWNIDLLNFSWLVYPLGSQAHPGLKISAVAYGMVLGEYGAEMSSHC